MTIAAFHRRSDQAGKPLRIVTTLLLLLASLIVAACDTTAPPGRPAPLTFDGMTPIGLDVARLEVVDAYQAPMQQPNIDHTFPQTPTDAMRAWAQSRFRPEGGSGTATLIIQDASVIKEDLPRTGGIAGVFTRDQSERLTASMRVRLEIEGGRRGGYAEARARRSITLAENVSVAEREAAWANLTRDTLQALNDQFVETVNRELEPVLR